MEELIADILKHIAVLNDEYGQIAVDVAVLKTEVGLLMWWFKAIMGAIVIMLVSQAWQLIRMKRNGS